MTAPIQVYAPNLSCRTDRRTSLEHEFLDKPEFELHIVPAIENENGAWGLWQTFHSIVAIEAQKESDFFIFCEDDHTFTQDYDKDTLMANIAEANQLGADLLSGGMSWLSRPVQISPSLFHVDAFNGMQFTVVYRRFYSKILAYQTKEGFVTDAFLSSVSENVYVVYPFISTQKEFGYSDVTSRNNENGRVTSLFCNMRKWLKRLDKVYRFYHHAIAASGLNYDTLPDLQQICISTYVINKPERTYRWEHMAKEFSGHPEFDVHRVEACEHRIGAVGLWHSFRKVVQKAKDDGEDVILVCEDDHFFTADYDRKRFMQQVFSAGMLGTQLLLGGIGGFGDMVPVCNGLYWVDWFWCTQFAVIYRNAFDTILDATFTDHDVTDEFLSRILPNKLVIYPYISEQKDFGYSDVTATNNNKDKMIEQHFQRSREKTEGYLRLDARLHVAPDMQHHAQSQPWGAYLKSGSDFKGLQLGCGENLLEGWLNTDFHPQAGAFKLDATAPFPFEDDTFDAIFSEHMFEHLKYADGKHMLQECLRVLKPGGVLRLTLPTLDFLLKLYNEPEKELHQRYAEWSLRHYDAQAYVDFSSQGKPIPMSVIVNNFMHLWGHQFLYDKETLCTVLKNVGFHDLEVCHMGESRHAALQNVERHQEVIPLWASELESFCIEATK